MTTAAVETVQLRCRSKLHGIRKEYPDGKVLLEVRCKDKWCADRSAGLVVLHYFNLETGELDHTKRFRDPKGQRNKPNSSSTPSGRSKVRKVKDNA